ncbi:MAG: lactate racemase domain-containing protein [Isosphaeraceae bacterium]
MQVSLAFQDEQLALELSGDNLVGSWMGPPGFGAEAAEAALRDVLEQPFEFPPVRQMVVPGDRVAIALDRSLCGVQPVLHVLGEILRESGVEAGDVSVVTSEDSRVSLDGELPPGMALVEHDPGDRSRMAYLSTTKDGRRIYLNRSITDADVVIPVGRLGYDPVLGYRGPWSVLFPGLSDQDTKAAYRHRLQSDPPGRATPAVRLDETFEVSWLLGTQFHLGLVPGSLGLAGVLAGLAEPVRDQGIRRVDQLWNYQAPARAECVVVGIGAPGTETGIGELVDGLVTASRLVNHGGKIVAVSRARGSIGPSLQRLRAVGDAREAVSALRGHEADLDSIDGRRLAQVLDWADVYLQSRLDRQVVEDMFMVPLDDVDDVRRIVSRAGSCLVVSRADLTRATIREG